MRPAFRMLSTSGLLGYGFPEASLRAGMARAPDMIGVDGGSTDPGPYYLGSGKCLSSSLAMRRDLELMLCAAAAARIPLVIGSCGGAGGKPHVLAVTELAREIARQHDLHFRLAVIHAEQDKEVIKLHLAAGHISPLSNAPELDRGGIERAERIVAMMGAEPFVRALDEGAQVVLAGRSSDPAPWAAAAMRAGLPPAPSWYAGKMLECGATASVPKGHDCLLATVEHARVEVEPMNPGRRCTPLSVANHSLHENASPVLHLEPGGRLDTSECTFEAISARAVRISGMAWQPRPNSVKLEGAELVGHRAITICGTRDPMLIRRFDDFIGRVRDNVEDKAGAFGVSSDQYRLVFRVYGRDGVMGPLEPVREIRAHELGILVEVIADAQEIANAVLAVARANLLHTDFPGRLCREGNMAFPLSPSDAEIAPHYRFSICHELAIDDPLAPFAIDYEDL